MPPLRRSPPPCLCLLTWQDRAVAFVALLRRQSRPQLRPPARETLPKLQRCHWAKHAAVRPRSPHLSTPAWPLRAQVWRNGATPAGARRTPPRPGAPDPPERSWFSGDPHICRADYSSFAIGVRPKRQDFSWFSPKENHTSRFLRGHVTAKML